MHLKLPFLIMITLVIGLVLTTNGESDVKENPSKQQEKQKSWNKQVSKIMMDEKYLSNRANSIEELIGYGATFTTEDVNSAFDGWLRSVQRRDGDLSLIHFTLDMLSESNKEKFNSAIQGINRKEVIDKLEALELVINKASDIDSSVFSRLINSKYNLYNKSDMSAHWLEYFLSKEKVDLNSYGYKSLMSHTIQANNFPVAQILIRASYKVIDKDFDYMRDHRIDIQENDEGTVDKEKALGALSKIENIMTESLKH